MVADGGSVTSSLTSYPPPLSEAPTVGTLRGLLVGLQDGTRRVPPSPPLPVPGGRPSPVREAMHVVDIRQWRVEHAASGLPVALRVGDPLDAAQLMRLRDELGMVGGVWRSPPPPEPAPVEAESESRTTASDLRALAVVGAAALAAMMAILAATGVL